MRADASLAERRLGELMRQGLLAPARGSCGAPLPQRKPLAKIAELLDELAQSRAER